MTLHPTNEQRDDTEGEQLETAHHVQCIVCTILLLSMQCSLFCEIENKDIWPLNAKVLRCHHRHAPWGAEAGDISGGGG